MRELRKWAWTAIVAAAAAAPVSAQQGTSTTVGGRTTTSLSGTGGLAGGGTGSVGGTGGLSGGNGLGGSGSGSLGGSTLQGTQLQTMQSAPQISAPTGTGTSSLDSSNRFGTFYANPYFQGNTLQVNAAPGGFGIATKTGGASAAGLGGTAGRTGATGRTGVGGLGGQNSQQSGIVVPLPVQISYTARMQFPTPPVAAGKIVAEVRSVIDNTSAIANPKNVQIITDANNNVTIRGIAKDDDEARLIEGLVRITPGVGAIRNELTTQVAATPKNDFPLIVQR